MTKWIVGLLVLLNLALFGWMRWGEALTEDAGLQQARLELNADKVRLIELDAATSGSAASAPPLVLSPPVSASLPVPVAPAVPVAAAAVPQAGCAEWGEFSGTDLARVQQELAALKLGDRLAQRIVEQDRGYWVYMPPQPNKAGVERKIQQLKERGVYDHFVVQEPGEWHYAISLGVFKTEEAAQKFLAFLRTRDVRTAKVGERKSTLKFTVFLMNRMTAADIEQVKALHKSFPDSQLKISACPN